MNLHSPEDEVSGRGAAAQSEDAGAAAPQGGFANPSTVLLLIILAGFFWWSVRRRRAQEERIRELRRQEVVTHAAQSAQDVANLMRQRPSRESAEAAVSQGLAAAARMPDTPAGLPLDAPSSSENGAHELEDVARELQVERAEAAERADRVAHLEAADAERRADLTGESEARRLAAARAAAEEARADGAEVIAGEQETAAALRAALTDLSAEQDAPFGATPGNGTSECPPEFPIKGNAQSMIYHEPGQVSYAMTIAEFCFASGDAAEAAGYRQSRARGQRAQE